MKVTYCDICGAVANRAFALRVGGQTVSVVVEDFEICEPCRASLLQFIRDRRAASEPAPHVVVFQKELPT